MCSVCVQYAAAFDTSGFNDWEVLAALDENDLESIELAAGISILPGHRKKILMASKQMGQVSRHEIEYMHAGKLGCLSNLAVRPLVRAIQ